jgi:hypothetical protein
VLTPEQIVDVLPAAARAEFSDLFYQSQIRLPAEERREVSGIADGAAGRQALVDALTLALAENWLDSFIELLISKGLASGEIVQDYLDRTKDTKLHSMIDSARGYAYPSQIKQGIADAMRWTAKVLYDGQPVGTGILISPDLVLTSFHPLNNAFDRTPKNGRVEWTPRAAAAGSITFAFDDVLVFRGRGRPEHAGSVIVKAAAKWHVSSSPCHLLELAKQVPANKLELDNFWDYVIVRLAQAPGLERRWATFDQRSVVPPEKDQIYIVQHPGGNNMKVDDNDVGGPKDFTETGDRHDIRFIHYVNSDGGSSGAPCFDKSFSLFGIHQGEWPHPPARKNKANRGIAVTNIIKHVLANGGLPPPEPANVPIWNLADEGVVPAIGREDFQAVVWNAALKNDLRIIVIRGGSDSGKSFLLDVLAAMLPDKMHAKVEIKAETVAKTESAAFIEKICTLAHAPIPEIPRPEDYNTSRVLWREAMIRKLVESLNSARGDRITWLLFRDVNKSTFAHESLELVRGLCVATANAPALRIVLDGFDGDLPQEANAIAKPFSTALLTAAELETFFLRLNAAYELGIEAAIKGVVKALVKKAGINATNRTLALDVTAQALAWIEA